MRPTPVCRAIGIILLLAFPAARSYGQDTLPLRLSADAKYFDFWPGTWYKIVDGKPDTGATKFQVIPSVHPAALQEEWRMVLDSGPTIRATALRAWDKTNARWMYTWVSDNGLFQVWEGRKVRSDWYFYRPFDIAGDRYLSRQGWIPLGPGRVMRVSEKSYDGKTWQLRFREYFARSDQPLPSRTSVEDSSHTDDVAAVRRVAGLYLEAQRTGDGRLISRTFHPAARVAFLRADTLGTISTEEFAAHFSGSPPPDAPRTLMVRDVSVSGRAAIARVELDGPRGHVTDYLTMMRLGTGWRIVAKATDFTPPPSP